MGQPRRQSSLTLLVLFAAAALATLALLILSFVEVRTAEAAIHLGDPNTASLSNGLVGYWPLDGSVTSWRTYTTADLSGSGKTGTLVNLATTTSPGAGKIGQALTFDGTQYITAPAITTISSALTVSLWLRTSSNGGFSVSQWGTNNGFGLYTDGNWYMGNGSWFPLNAGVLTDDKWHLYNLTWNGAAMVAYRDGIQVGTPAAASGLTFSSPLNGVLAIATDNRTPGPVGDYVGSVDDVRIYNRALSPTEVQQLYHLGTANAAHSNTVAISNGLVDYWTMDGNSINWATGPIMTNMSSQGYPSGLISMSTTTSPVAGKIGQALKFNGSSSFIDALNNYSIQDTTPFTFSAWVIDNTGSGSIISNAYQTIGGGAVMYTTGATLHITVTDAPYTNYRDVGTTGTFSLSKWHHMVATYNGSQSANGMNLYIDGVLQAKTIVSDTAPGAVTNYVIILGLNQRGGGFFNGAMDDVRIYNRALTAGEVQQLYNLGTANAAHSNTVALSNGLVGYWTFDGGSIDWRKNQMADASGNGNTGTLVSMSTSTSPVAGKVGQAFKFDGSSSYVDVGNISGPSGSVTIAAWVYKMSDQVWTSIVDRKGTDNSDCLNLGFDYSTGKKLMFVWNSPEPWNTHLVVANSDISDGKWVHVAASSNGSTVTFYVNGVADGGGAAGAPCATGNIVIGANFPGVVEYFNGKIDDVRIYNRALTAGEVQQLYNMGR